jgi:hypothetical protein
MLQVLGRLGFSCNKAFCPKVEDHMEWTYQPRIPARIESFPTEWAMNASQPTVNQDRREQPDEDLERSRQQAHAPTISD